MEPIPKYSPSAISSLLGPFSLKQPKNVTVALTATVLLTLFTQVGGILLWPFWHWVFSLWSGKNRWQRNSLRCAMFTLIYLTLSQTLVPLIAHRTGRIPLPIMASAELPLGPLNILYPLLQRNYVRHHVHTSFTTSVKAATSKNPGMVVRYLDAGFPFPVIPLLPHLSHRDGRKIDVAFQFQRDGNYVDQALSPIGYWGYAKESKGRDCAGGGKKFAGLTIPLRWDFDWLQPLWPNLDLDKERNRALFSALEKEKALKHILLEPTLKKVLPSTKLAENSCNVARHDDHFHLSYH
jgi:hypothetical protein